jgi:GTP-binding protein HflX
VGFIQKLPTTLVAAFRATLEEIGEADLLLHIVDINHPNALEQARSVYQTLKEIDADKLPIITILNKIDLLNDPDQVQRTISQFPNSVAVSAQLGIGIDKLIQKINDFLFETMHPVTLKIPEREENILHMFTQFGQVERLEHDEQFIIVVGSIAGRYLARFLPYQIMPDTIP